MGFCGNCRSTPKAAVLFQIRQGYHARWNDLDLTVELDSGQWSVRVDDRSRGQVMYRAYRADLAAAKLAAADFAVVSTLGFASTVRPELLASELVWQGSWARDTAA